MQTKDCVYLACPYTHEDETVRAHRFEQANLVSGYLMLKNLAVISPISMGHAIHSAGNGRIACLLGEDWNAWGDTCLRLLAAADELCVLCLDGVESSFGVAEEIKEARALEMPITKLISSGGHWYKKQNPNFEGWKYL